MVGELYKMFHKKYCIALMFLLLIPILFGLGYFFNLSYIIDNEENMSSMLGYCFEMQVDIKYLYFFVVIFLACDMFSAEIEEGQIRTLLVYTASRKKVFLQKYGALCFLLSIFHMLFWIFNAGIYWVCNIKNDKPIVFIDNPMPTYIGMFLGYLEAFFVWISVAFFIGIFFRKIYSMVFVYFIWFACRYINELIGLKNVSTEFMADYFGKSMRNMVYQDILCYMINLFLCIGIICISLYLFERKDIS